MSGIYDGLVLQLAYHGSISSECAASATGLADVLQQLAAATSYRSSDCQEHMPHYRCMGFLDADRLPCPPGATRQNYYFSLVLTINNSVKAPHAACSSHAGSP